ITNPRHERTDRARLAKAQRVLARKEKGSRNRAKARLKVAKIHGRIADRRRDYLHTLSTRLVRENQVIAIEDLSVRNMVKNRSYADLDLAADAMVNAGFGSAGERCMAISALVAVGDIADELVAKITERTNTLKIGDGTKDSDMGPLVTKVHRDKVASYIDAGEAA
ncbi:aldehyde dehydrogenase family protein, partial [Rhodococcus sp. T2V]|uniref:RNA-guided endonuclease InsQ/TnpB family protein n=1 Tax=Rhodococcus sp. T2V TaxID=3034164 RepID=UPI0023E34E93